MFILQYLFSPIVILLIIIWLARRHSANASAAPWYLKLAQSLDDGVSQLLLVLSVLFLGTSMLAINRDLGQPVNWQTIVLLVSLIGIWVSYKWKVYYALILSLVGIVVWWLTQGGDWLEKTNISYAGLLINLILLFVIYYLVGRIQEKYQSFKQHGVIFVTLGLVAITGFLFFISLRVGLSVLNQLNEHLPYYRSLSVLTFMGIFSVSIIGLSVFSLYKKMIFVYELIAVLVVSLVAMSISMIAPETLFSSERSWSQDLSSTGYMWALLYNIVVFLHTVFIIMLGYLKREEWLVNLGTVFLFILVVVKYFDWFFSFLDKSVFFIGAGLVLFGIGWVMERGRRYMIQNLTSEKKKTTNNNE